MSDRDQLVFDVIQGLKTNPEWLPAVLEAVVHGSSLAMETMNARVSELSFALTCAVGLSKNQPEAITDRLGDIVLRAYSNANVNQLSPGEVAKLRELLKDKK